MPDRGDHPRPHASAHHGNADEQDTVLKPVPQKLSGTAQHQQRNGHGNKGHRQKAVGGTDQKGSVHAQNRAYDDGCNKKVQETGCIDKGIDIFLHRLRKHPEIGAGCRSEDTDHRSSSQIASDHRKMFSDPVEQTAEKHQHQQGTDHASRKTVSPHGKQYRCCQQQIEGKRYPVYFCFLFHIYTNPFF